MPLVMVVTWLTDGCTCSRMLPFSSICGVTSSTTPEKKGCRVTLGVTVLPVALVLVVVVTPVTKNSSVPIFSTAFWLLTAATRGLDNTWTVPCCSSSEIRAAKLFVWKAKPNRAPAAFAAFESEKPVLAARPLPLLMMGGWPPLKGSGASEAPGPITPVLTRLLRELPIDEKLAQLIPLWNWSFSSTSRIFASRITWRSTESWVAFRYMSTLRSSSGMARITSTPDCGLTTTLRPPSFEPTMASIEDFRSTQKSLFETVLTSVLSTCAALPPFWFWLLPPWFWLPCCPCCPWLLPPLLLLPTLDTEVEVTRRFEEPRRLPTR